MRSAFGVILPSCKLHLNIVNWVHARNRKLKNYERLSSSIVAASGELYERHHLLYLGLHGIIKR
jgi:hypothetical protein